MYCEVCGSKLMEGDIFCGECGHRVQVEDDKTAPFPIVNDKPILDVTAPMEAVKMNVEQKRPQPVVPVYKQNNEEMKPIKETKEKKIKQKKIKEKKKFDGKCFVIILLIVALLASFACAFLGVIPTAKQLGLPIGLGSASKTQGSGYDSPEDAVEAYITAINNEDINGMLATFAIESYVDNFNVEAHLDRLKAFVPTSVSTNTYPFTEDDDFSRDIRIAQRRGIIATAIYKQLMNITIYEIGYDPALSVAIDDEDEISDFANALKDASTYEDWKNMEFVEFAEPEDIFDDWSTNRDDQMKDLIKIEKKIYGAEDVKYVTAVIEAGGDEYYQFITCVKYNGKWYNSQLYSMMGSIAGLSMDTQGLCPVDEIY